MVAVRVRADDRGDALAFGRLQDTRYVLRISRPGIDNRHLAHPDNIGLRARMRKRRRITREHAPDERRQDLCSFIGRRVHDPHVARQSW